MSRRPWQLSYRGRLRIAVENDGQGSTLYYEGSSEPDVEDTITRFLKEGMTFVDVGAHVGTYTLLAAQAVGRDGEVHAFEPNPAAFKLLELNLRLNGFSNVNAHPCAVADTGGTSELAIYAEATISSLAPREGGAGGRAVLKTVRTEVVRLDDLFALSGKRVDLVKVDVEGAELMVFRGARGLLERAAQEAPVWVFEYEPENYARFGYVLADLARFLRRYDYELWLPRPGGRAVKTDPLDVPRGVRNLLAAKKGTCLSSIL